MTVAREHRPDQRDFPEPRRLEAAEHGLDHARVDAAALSVIEGLRSAGFEALLVGGCVRDLLLGLRPKDFDVATSATPEDVKRVFRRARLVGRRFRIAHVRVGRDVIEVSTFRRLALASDDDEDEPPLPDRSAQGMLLRDNVYGSIEEDAFRRDFTINALYYDPISETVVDYMHGVADLKAGHLRLIGDPSTRYREDPVRILRAIRFAAKLGLQLEPATAAAIPDTVHLISEVAPARLFDEICKLFLSGAAEKAWQILIEWDLVPYLFPDIDPAPERLALIEAAMRGTDTRVREERPVTPGFLLAALLWDLYQQRLALSTEGRITTDARDAAASDAIRFQAEIMAIPRRFGQFVREVWALQPKLEARVPKSIERLVQQPRFRAAYDFLLLRSEIGEQPTELADWWTRYQEVDPDERTAMRAALAPTAADGKKRRRRPRRRKPDKPE